MNFIEGLIIVFLLHVSVLVTPGPNLLLVAKSSMSGGMKNGLFTTLGISLGISFHIVYSLVLLYLLPSEHTISKLVNLKYVASAYLIYIAWRGFKQSQRNKFNQNISKTLRKYFNSFKNGLLIDFLNPMIGIFYFLLWSSMHISNLASKDVTIYGLFSLILVLLWFTFISFVFSRNKFMAIYEKYSIYFEKASSIILIIFAILLATN